MLNAAWCMGAPEEEGETVPPRDVGHGRPTSEGRPAPHRHGRRPQVSACIGVRDTLPRSVNPCLPSSSS